MNKYQQILNKLDGGEKDILSKLDNIFSSLNENEGTKQKGIEYIKKNFKNFSQAMLMALLLNPNISSAINNTSPELFNQIKTELSTTKPNTDNKSTGIAVVNFSENFSSGKFDLQNAEDLKSKLLSLKKYNINKYQIKIIASESKVTNPSGFEKGGLAKKRAEVLKNLLEKSGITTNINIETKIGSTPYSKGTDDPNNSKYTQEQFVRVEVTTPY
jgi:hypothetical protein